MAEVEALQIQVEIAAKYAHHLDQMVYHRSIEVDMRKLFFVFAISILLSGCEFWEVDKCLDQGGRWNYEKKKCEFEENMQLENKPTSDRGKED